MNIYPLDSFPKERLAAKEEAALAQGTESQLETLVLHTMREAVIYARKCVRETIPDDELISLCYEALSRSAKRWKSGWARFFAFSKPAVRGVVRKSWTQKNSVKGVPGEKTVHTDALPQPSNYIFDQDNLEDDDKEVTPEHEIQTGGGLEHVYISERMELVTEIIKKVCNKRQREILDMVYQGHLNFKQVADLMGISRAAVQRAHQVALLKVRVVLMERGRLSNPD